ncbi:MAG: hypothetical protein ACD_45C00622G0015 [uncultured bacterium]|nr:MAG: hypothetical protein ACD_45C00622G0015 [uncultured bacterium]
MFKKLLIVSGVLAASSSVAFAGGGNYKGEEMAPCPVFTYTAGPYVGLSLGSRNNYSGSPTVFRGIDGNLSLGYGMMMSQFYLAGEIFGIWTANVKDLQYTQGTTSTSAKSNWAWGISLLPGYMIVDRVLGYVRLGGGRTHFNGTGVSDTVTGWHIGPGASIALNQNWDLRGEYIYTRYNTVTNLGKTSSDVFNLGVVYKFL